MSSEMSRNVYCHDVMIFRHDPLLTNSMALPVFCMMMIKQRLAVLEDNIYSVPAVVSGARVRTSHIASNPLPLPDIPHAGDSWWIGGVKTGQFLHGNC